MALLSYGVVFPSGFVIAVARGRASEEVFDSVFEEGKVDIPKAPALGLLLENVTYTLMYRSMCTLTSTRCTLTSSHLRIIVNMWMYFDPMSVL